MTTCQIENKKTKTENTYSTWIEIVFGDTHYYFE